MPFKNLKDRKEYHKKYYLKNKEKFSGRTNLFRLNISSKIEKIKSEKGCSKCGEMHPACLDFHHIDEKEKDHGISWIMRNSSKFLLENEMKKCIVLCSNCHRKLHWKKEIHRDVV